MKFPRPRSLNGLILVGFGIVALPLLLAVLWALYNLDRLADQSQDLVNLGVQSAENNRLLAEHVVSLDRAARQYNVLGTDDARDLMLQDLETTEATLEAMRPLTERANATGMLDSIGTNANRIVTAILAPDLSAEQANAVLGRFADLRYEVSRLTGILSGYIELELIALEERTREAQQIAAWTVALLVPGTLVLVLIFTLLVARPIRQIDRAIHQLGQSGFAKPIEIRGPSDLERLGRQLDWLRLRLLELAQEKNRFLRHMSHELKTPLASIREGTELLLDGTLGELDKPQQEVTDILRSNGMKLQRLIENLLSFSAWQSKNEVLTLTDFPLRALVISVAKEQRLALKSAHVQLRLDVADIIVNADRDKMRTVLDNLLSNAVKFTPRGGYVTIRADAAPNGFTLEFADTGPGVPEDERPRVFEAFFQGRREQGGQVGGTGIGLSVVLECVQAHDGAVELVDSDEFPGAHFRIFIPQKRVPQTQKIAAHG